MATTLQTESWVIVFRYVRGQPVLAGGLPSVPSVLACDLYNSCQTHSARIRRNTAKRQRGKEQRRTNRSWKMDLGEFVVKPLKDFGKNSIRLVKRCTKPDQKGACWHGCLPGVLQKICWRSYRS